MINSSPQTARKALKAQRAQFGECEWQVVQKTQLYTIKIAGFGQPPPCPGSGRWEWTPGVNRIGLIKYSFIFTSFEKTNYFSTLIRFTYASYQAGEPGEVMCTHQQEHIHPKICHIVRDEYLYIVIELLSCS